MKGKIAVVGKQYFTDGFLLGGIHDIFPANEENEAQILERLLEEKKYALIFITEGTKRRLPWKLKKKVEESTYPLVITLPNIKGEGEEDADLHVMVKRALGIDILKTKK